jgi:hypothetical protein
MSFTLGANLPWVRYGGDFGANAWSPDGGFATRPADRQRVREVLSRLASTGVTRLRWFLLCDLRAGVRFHRDGTPIEVQASAWKDIDAAIGAVGRAGLQLMPVLFDFHLCRPRRIVNGVQLGGRSRLIAHADLRAQLLDNVLSPLLAHFGRVPEIAAWDLFNEPEWAVFRVGTWNPVSSVSKGAMRAFLQAAATRTHELTRHEVTVGSASVLTLNLVRGLGLDFYQPHWYDRFEARAPLGRPSSVLACDRPVVLGEFPTFNSARTPDELFAAAEENGYAGAYFWSALAEDQHTHLDHATAALARRIVPTPHTS